MASNFEEIMSKQTDEEIIRILTKNADDYQPAALQVARKEFEKRNLSADIVENIKNILEKESKIKQVRANESLSFFWKFLTLYFPRSNPNVFVW